MVSHLRKSNPLLIRGAVSICLVFIGARALPAPLGIAEVSVNESIGGYHVDHHEDPAIASAALSYTLGSGWSEANLPRGTLKTYVQTSTSDVVESAGAQVNAYASLEDYFTVSGLAPGTSAWITGNLHVTGTLTTPPGQSANWYSGVLVNFGGSWGRELWPTEGGEVGIDTVLTQAYLVNADEAFRVYATLSSYGWGWNHNDIRSDFSGTAALTFDLPMGTSITSEGGYAPAPPGDYNENGTVDSADYVIWRKTDGTQAGYDAWRAHFGQTAGSGSSSTGGSTSQAAVPEPTSALLLILGAAAGTWKGRRIASRVPTTH